MFSLYRMINSANTPPMEEKNIDLQKEGTIKKICISCNKEFLVTFFNFSKTPSVIEDRMCICCDQDRIKLIQKIKENEALNFTEG